MKKILSIILIGLLIGLSTAYTCVHTHSPTLPPSNSNAVFKNWLNYYKQKNNQIQLSNFKLNSSKVIDNFPGNVIASYQENFDSTYIPLFVYNKDRTKYIDFESYSFFIEDNKVVNNTGEQEINVIDIANKENHRIAFRGFEEYVEDAFWQNDSTIILLEYNLQTKQPFINKICLNQQISYFYTLNSKVTVASDYYKQRLEKLGLTYSY